MGSGGDGGRAFADAGDGAVLGDGGDGFIAGFPGEVGGGVERGVAGTAIDQQLDGAAGVDGRGGRHHPALGNGHDDAHVDLGADAGAVGGDGGNLDGAGPVAGHSGGAVAVVADAGIAGVAHAPVERLSNGSGGAVRANGSGGEGQIAVADGNHSLTAAKDADVDVVGADADGDGAAFLNAVVGSDGDGRRAFADAGDDAGIADGGDALIAGFPGEVLRGVVGGVAGRAVELEGRRAAHVDCDRRGDDVEGLDRHDDVHLHLGVDAGTVGGKSADGDRTGAQARHGGGAVEVFDDAGIAGVAHAPLHVLRHIDGGTIFIVGHGAHDQARAADADLRPLGVDQFQLDLAHGDGDADSADSLQAVVRSGGDGGGALANAGDHAGFVDDNHVFIAGFPREVGGGMERGVGRRAVGAQLQLAADEQIRHRGLHPGGGDGHDDAHGNLSAPRGAVVGIGVDLHGASAHAAHGAGAVKVLAHLSGLRIGGLPGEVLRHVFAGVVGPQRRGAQRQIAGADVDFRPFAAHQGDLDLVGGNGHRHQAVIGEPVVGNGGDDGRAVADAGDHAVFNGRDVRVAGFPGEVGGRMVGGVAGRAVGAQRHSLANEQMFAVGNVEAGDRHHDGDGDLAAHAGAVLGGGVDLGAAGAHAAHRAGAVDIGAHLDDVPIAGTPGEVLADVQIVAIRVGRHGAQHQVAGTDVDVGAFRVHRLDGDLAGRHRHRNDADLGEAVVGGGGDGGRADAGGGQFALRVDGDDVLIAAPPGKIGGRIVGGVGGSAAKFELLLLADEELHHFRINIETLHRHDDAHGDLAENAGAIGGVGIDLHSAGGKAGHGAGAVAVGVHAGIARVGGFPGEVLLYAVGGAVRAVGGGAQRQIAGADGHLGLARVHRIDDDRAHGVGDLHQTSGRAVVERARDQAHLARFFAREVAAGVNAGGAGHRFHRPEDGAGLGVRGGDGGGKALALADDDFPGRR